MNDEKEILKKQIQMHWDYAKVEADIHCRVYLQIFVVLITIGFSVIIAGFTETLKDYAIYTILLGIILFLASLTYVFKINELTSKLEGLHDFLLGELENLK